MAYVEGELRVITIRSHSDAGVRKGRLSPRSELAGERLSSWPQIHPSTTNAGHIWFWCRRDFGRFESKAYFGVIGQNVELALEVASRGYVLEAGAATLADSAAELRNNPAVITAYRGV